MTEDDGRHGAGVFWKAQFGASLSLRQPALGKTDPAGAQAFVVGREHQIFRRKGAILDGHIVIREGADHHERRGAVDAPRGRPGDEADPEDGALGAALPPRDAQSGRRGGEGGLRGGSARGERGE